MATLGHQGRDWYDISFCYSFRCDLKCSFCMYSSGPDVDGTLDLTLVEFFIRTIDQSCVNAYGIYGGEPFLFLRENSAILDKLPKETPKFVITNGTWSTRASWLKEFMNWAEKYDLNIFVSGTTEHERHQYKGALERLAIESRIICKKAESSFIPMGRLAGTKPCTQLCDRDTRPTRIAVRPDGYVMFQNCDGSYPVVGHASEGFGVIRERLRRQAWNKCPLYSASAVL